MTTFRSELAPGDTSCELGPVVEIGSESGSWSELAPGHIGCELGPALSDSSAT